MTDAEGHGWRLPARPVAVLMTAAVCGLIGLIWSQRYVFSLPEAPGILMEASLESDTTHDPLLLEAGARWRLVPGGAAGPEIVAEVTVPERRQLIRFSIRRNTDEKLPASHIIEILAEEPVYPGRRIAAIPVVFLKPSPDATGRPLIGVAVRVSTDRFWIALSTNRFDMNANARLLREGNVFELPMAYETGRRAILGFEKGEQGRRVFEEALSAWSQ